LQAPPSDGERGEDGNRAQHEDAEPRRRADGLHPEQESVERGIQRPHTVGTQREHEAGHADDCVHNRQLAHPSRRCEETGERKRQRAETWKDRLLGAVFAREPGPLAGPQPVGLSIHQVGRRRLQVTGWDGAPLSRLEEIAAGAYLTSDLQVGDGYREDHAQGDRYGEQTMPEQARVAPAASERRQRERRDGDAHDADEAVVHGADRLKAEHETKGRRVATAAAGE
jgi:hypothetical protein